jgi:hypothetical protein
MHPLSLPHFVIAGVCDETLATCGKPQASTI